MSSKDVAGELTNYDWEMFSAVHEASHSFSPLLKVELLVLAGHGASSSDSVLAPPGGTRLLRLRPSEVPRRRHGEPGAVGAALQRGSALGGDRAVPLRRPAETGRAAQEVHQDRCSVSSDGPETQTRPGPNSSGEPASPLCQFEGAEESELVLRGDVRVEQQRGSETLQDLGGEKVLLEQVFDPNQLLVLLFAQRIPGKTKRIYCSYERLMVRTPPAVVSDVL